MNYIIGWKCVFYCLSSYWCCNCFIKAIRFYNAVRIALFSSLLRYQLNTMVVDTEAGPYRNRTVVFLGSTRGTVLKFLITPSPENQYSNTNTFLEELEGYNPERWWDFFASNTIVFFRHCLVLVYFACYCLLALLFFCQTSGKKTSKIYIYTEAERTQRAATEENTCK